MRKHIKKIICLTLCAATAVGMGLAGCSGVFRSPKLDGSIAGEVESNGGFAVKKGEYIYYVNGVQNYTVDNTYGTPVKGAIHRISAENLAAHNYADVQTVVPLVAYSGSHSSGIYIYGDYVYYSTPSTAKNSDGEVQNTYLDFKRSKLDGSETQKDAIYTSSDNTIDYRYVEANDAVYLMYAIKENLYGSDTTNLHSVNVETGADTLLAYDVASYVFDSEDLENPYVYYTMSVNRYEGKSDSSDEKYNQIYRVKADDTTSLKEYDFGYITDYDAEKNPVYVNLGEYVFDGIGKSDIICQFNANYGGEAADHSPYVYSLNYYKNGTLYYTRKSTDSSSKGFFFTVSDGDINGSWDAVKNNPTYDACLLMDATSVSDYLFTQVNGSEKIIYKEGNAIMIGEPLNGEIKNQFTLTMCTGTPTFLFTKEEGSLSYLYYSVTGGNGYTVNRIVYNGQKDDYVLMPAEEDLTYRAIKVLDLDAVSNWYLPEIFDNQIIFASETGKMSSYNYIQVCDLRNAGGQMMTNAEIKALNEKFEGVSDKIGEVDSTVYENLPNALRYLYYTGDAEYLEELVQAGVDVNGWDIEHDYSKESVAIYKDFANCTGDWASYADDVKTVNGKNVAANMQEYYYSVLGVMAEADAEACVESYKTSYMTTYPVKDTTWWENLETWVKVVFIVGVSLGGIVVIGGVTVVVLYIVKKRKTKKPVYRKSKIKVDTTDDKSVDVYSED